MRPMKKETKKNIIRVIMFVAAVVMILGFVLLPIFETVSAEENEGYVTVDSFETGALSAAIDKAKNGVDLNNITRISVSGGSLSEADYAAICGYPNIEYLELAGAQTEKGEIPANALASRNKLSYVSLPSNTVTIGDNAFSGNRALLKVSMPASVRNIGNSAFEGCELVEGFDIPAELETIGANAFADCKALAAFSLPEKITAVPEGCFNKASLTQMHIGPQVVSIGANAFADCHDLENVFYYGDTAPQIADGAFQNVHVTIHTYEGGTGFDALENNFISVAYDLDPESTYQPPKAAADSAPAQTEAQTSEVPATEGSAPEETSLQSEGSASEGSAQVVTAAQTQVTGSAPEKPAQSSGFSTLSVVIIAVLALAVGVFAALFFSSRKK